MSVAAPTTAPTGAGILLLSCGENMNDVTVAVPVPKTVDDLDATWLEQALQRACPGIQVTALEVEKVLWGTSTKVLVKAEYAGTEVVPPAQLCIKGELDARLADTYAALGITPTEIEARFYRNLAPQLGVATPRIWGAEAVAGQGGILVLDNLGVLGATFGAPTQPWTVEQVAAGLTTLATLHGKSFDRAFAGKEQLSVGSKAVRDITQNVLFSEQNWSGVMAGPVADVLPAALHDRQRILAGYRASYAINDAQPLSLAHGDAHIGNTYIDADGQLLFLDWATICLQPWAADVAYFLVGSLAVDQRAAHEQTLLRDYLTQLHAHGGPAIEWETAWLAYRQNLLHGIIWATLPETMQARDGVLAMTQRFASAIVDHDTFGALGV